MVLEFRLNDVGPSSRKERLSLFACTLEFSIENRTLLCFGIPSEVLIVSSPTTWELEWRIERQRLQRAIEF